YDALRIGLIGVFFGIVAFDVVGTDALRGFYVARQSPGRRTEAVATVFVDRVIGLLTMFLAAFLGLFAGALASSPGEESAATLAAIRFVCWFAGAAFAVGVAGLFTALMAPQWERYGWFLRCESLPFVGPLLHRMVRLMAYFGRRLPTLGTAFILSALVNVCFIVAIYSVACFVSDQHPTLGDHVTIAPISMVANAVPLPGGIGGMEAALDLLYQAFTANRLQPQMGVAVAFLFRFLLLSIALLGAVAWFTLPARQRAELRHANASDDRLSQP
ncbi:MAG TPA: lysylphosphatidylglycerol synthase transmembrane domain-containing protein, partial [Pirellulaceae bacterium]|nr:lysylphosphatidylglycerol synthase transmembrane domain-containing protein [Pirellulaceae bacterium]